MNKKDICIAELGSIEEVYILRGLLQSENIDNLAYQYIFISSPTTLPIYYLHYIEYR